MFSLPRAIDSLPTEGSLDLFIHLPTASSIYSKIFPNMDGTHLPHSVKSDQTKSSTAKQDTNFTIKHIFSQAPNCITLLLNWSCGDGNLAWKMSFLGAGGGQGPWGPMNKGDGIPHSLTAIISKS